jgi:putative aldouronate transport system permease protein
MSMPIDGRLNNGISQRFIRAIKKYKYMYLMLIPGIILVIILRYVPMYGVIMAFEKFRVNKGYWGSQWVGLQHFIDFLSDKYSFELIRNTFLLGIYNLIFAFPIPIIIALAFNEMASRNLKKVFQTFSYLPYFVSTVIIIGIFKEFFSLDTGVINILIMKLGGQEIEFFARPEWFRFIYISSGIWQGAGFGSILYMAAISNLNPEFYEAARMDGSSRFQSMRYITLPGIFPTVVVMFILSIGGLLGNDYTKILLIYTGQTYSTADVLQTYIYRLGVEGGNFSYTAAVGLLTSVVSFVFLYVTNFISKKVGENSLW